MIRFNDVSFTYGANEGQLPIRAVDHLSFHVKKGSHVALLGRNGSGKSTIARLINGLLLPDEGSVIVGDMDTRDSLDIFEIRRICGMVFQNPDNQLIGTTVADDIAFGPCNLELSIDEVNSRVDEALRKAGLTDLRDRAPHNLSGGQKQKLAIASVMAMEPECIILDEATSMLDPLSRQSVMELILELKDKSDISIVQITHHMEEAVLADYVYVISEGRITLEGIPAEVFDQFERVHAEGLSIPTHIEIARRIANATTAPYRPEDIFSFDGAVSFVRSVLSQFSPSDVPGDRRDTIDKSASKTVESEDRRVDDVAHESDRERVVEISDLSFAYVSDAGDPVKALKNVSLSVYKGEILGILGHTGSGKSTLIQHINGILPSKKGTVVVLGRDLSDRKVVREIRRHVGLLFQYPEDQLFEETVALDIAFAPKQLNRTPEQVERAVLRAAKRLGVDSILHRSPFELSGGQRRRVAIAGVLAAEPDIIMMDEPAAGLDPAGRDDLFSDLMTLADEGATLLIVSHDMETMASLCDRILILNDGEIAGCGTPREMTSSSEFLESVSLVLPSSKRFLNRFVDLFPNLDTNCYTAEEAADSLLRATAEECSTN
ncbi:MAG TPA: energy-coupling factor transporter ATPase [Bacillota bacterium]|jgi:energy-coupling factor transport system ATP-binding protein|nr:energy-coupling factor transporter ATPase [Bacillota bacterium]HQC48686.1 energy-coupling factor transporter ATPase [Bacillota bacterium]